MASWWVGQSTSPAFITDLVRVNVGDVLIGRIELISQNGTLFKYSCEFSGIIGTKLVAENLPQLTDCNETLEAYSISTDTDYPATDRTAFSGIKVQLGAVPAQLTWTPSGDFPPTVINNSASAGEIDVIYPKNEA